MPLSEFYQASIEGKIDSGQSKMPSRSSNPSSFMADNEFVELLWENGPAVMQRRFNRPRKTSISTTNFSSPGDRIEGKDSTAVNMRKIGRLEGIDAFASDLSPSDSSRNVRLSTQFDSMVPWINYPIEDSYCSDLFPEFSGLKDQPNVEQGITSKALADGLDSSRAGSNQMHRPSLFPSFMSRMEDLGTGGASNARQEGKSDDLLDIRLLKQDLAASKPDRVVGSMNSMNFSHFARPGMLGKANVQTANRLRSNENSATATGSNCIESTIIHSSSGSQSTSSIVELVTSAKTPRVERLEAVREEDMRRKNLDDDISRSNLRMFGAEKDHEAIIASSSVSSGNNAGATSDDPKQSAKRKNQEGEESDNHLEDPEDASVGIKMPNAAKGRNAKRSRTAEVHNLSERRRRDRINEKMRALQDLIPNCTKVDKASMLDEAIEYLKSLQLQVQMMSMGNGFCMPPINPMMLPSGMQPLHVPPIAHFSHMGMHMRFNYGMGMLDMNGSPGSPLIAAHPFNPIRGPYGIPQPTNLPMFAQGLPISVPPHAPQLKSFLGVPTNAKSMPGTSTRTATSSQAPDTSGAKDRSKDHKEKNLNLALMQKASADDSQGTNESSQQCTSNQTSSTSETAN